MISGLEENLLISETGGLQAQDDHLPEFSGHRSSAQSLKPRRHSDWMFLNYLIISFYSV